MATSRSDMQEQNMTTPESSVKRPTKYEEIGSQKSLSRARNVRGRLDSLRFSRGGTQ